MLAKKHERFFRRLRVLQAGPAGPCGERETSHAVTERGSEQGIDNGAENYL